MKINKNIINLAVALGSLALSAHVKPALPGQVPCEPPTSGRPNPQTNGNWLPESSCFELGGSRYQIAVTLVGARVDERLQPDGTANPGGELKWRPTPVGLPHYIKSEPLLAALSHSGPGYTQGPWPGTANFVQGVTRDRPRHCDWIISRPSQTEPPEPKTDECVIDNLDDHRLTISGPRLHKPKTDECVTGKRDECLILTSAWHMLWGAIAVEDVTARDKRCVALLLRVSAYRVPEGHLPATVESRLEDKGPSAFLKAVLEECKIEHPTDEAITNIAAHL